MTNVRSGFPFSTMYAATMHEEGNDTRRNASGLLDDGVAHDFGD